MILDWQVFQKIEVRIFEVLLCMKTWAKSFVLCTTITVCSFLWFLYITMLTLNILSDMLVPEFIVNKVKKKSTQQFTFYSM